MDPASHPPVARPSARFTLAALAMLGLVCAGAAAWVLPAATFTTSSIFVFALVVVMPFGVAMAMVWYRDRHVAELVAALARSRGRRVALEQSLQEAQSAYDHLMRAHDNATEANEKLERDSATDGLTGIINRRRFDEILGIEWLRAARAGTCLSLLMVDIDHFKRYNDHYGHVAGDDCLRRVAQLLDSTARRAGDQVARYGGEEFVVLLPGAKLVDAEELAQQCQQGMVAMALAHASSPSARHVTFSIGIACVYPSADRDPATIVNAADTAMYRAKTAGRARFATATRADWEIDKDEPRSQAAELA